MAKAKIPQPYPRVTDTRRADYGCLDESLLVPHHLKIGDEQLAKHIRAAIRNAEAKSSREAMAIPENATPTQLKDFYQKEGVELFKYFKKYIGDPAATAHQMRGKHYRDVGLELFRNRALQKGRMNSGWRYQFLNSALAENQAGENAREYSREEIELAILQALHSLHKNQNELPTISNAPNEILDAFGKCCREANLIDEAGQFNEPRKLLEYLIAV
jgi:hypothetical protein